MRRSLRREADRGKSGRGSRSFIIGATLLSIFLLAFASGCDSARPARSARPASATPPTTDIVSNPGYSYCFHVVADWASMIADAIQSNDGATLHDLESRLLAADSGTGVGVFGPVAAFTDQEGKDLYSEGTTNGQAIATAALENKTTTQCAAWIHQGTTVSLPKPPGSTIDYNTPPPEPPAPIGSPSSGPSSTSAAAQAAYNAALSDWKAGVNADAADMGGYWIKAAQSLKNAVAAAGSKSRAYSAAASELTDLASLPDANLTPDQQSREQTDISNLDTFFDTPGLYS